MKAREIMTENPACCMPSDSVRDAAKLMAANDCGCIPVVADMESRQIVGTVTDRDIACRCTAEGKGPETRVEEVMSPNPSCCGADDELEQVERIMSERQVRRVPVVDGSGCCIGMIAQADVARAADRGVSDDEVGRVVERISEPAGGRPRTEGRPRAESR